jgi:2-dehydropantoate 2-reductase
MFLASGSGARSENVEIGIVGSGGVGGYYGARLAHAGHTVHFQTRSDAEHIREQGLRVTSPEGDFSIDRPSAAASIADLPPCDLLLVAVKATANAQVIPQLGHALKPGGSMVLMQNGFGAEPAFAVAYPKVPLYAGLCFVCSSRVGPGHIEHAAYGKVSIAGWRPDPEGASALVSMFEDAGVEAEALPDVTTARLRKLVWNIPFNGLTVVLDATTAELLEDPHARALVRDMMVEVSDAAAAGGVDIPSSFIDEMLRTTDLMPAYDPSMRLDYLAGRPMELDSMYGNVITWARTKGFEMPRAQAVVNALHFLQSRRH